MLRRSMARFDEAGELLDDPLQLPSISPVIGVELGDGLQRLFDMGRQDGRVVGATLGIRHPALPCGRMELYDRRVQFTCTGVAEARVVHQ